LFIRVSILACSILISSASLVSAGISLGDFNVITTGNLSDNSDVQGRVLVGGSLLTNNFNFGGHLGSNSSLSTPAGIFNNLGSGVTNLDNNGTNFLFGSATSATEVNGISASPTEVASYTTNLASYLNSVSIGYAGLATNSTVSEPNNNQIAFNATPTTINGQSVAVFSVSQSFFEQSGTVSSLTGVTAGTTVIINVTGGADSLSFQGLNFSAFQQLNDQANIIFNFENVTALNGVSNLGGSILAPDAVLNTGNSLTGGIYVQSIASVGEIDLANSMGTPGNGFTGFVTVPEPSSIVSTMLGVSLVVGCFRHRRRTGEA
jgi:choice-of-anchor A domain-containing protein